MRINKKTAIFCSVFCLSVIQLAGCAGLSIPAPEYPVIPLGEPVIADSVINVPISISLKSVVSDLGRILPKSAGREAPDLDKMIGGKIQDFLRRQGSSSDSKLIQNRYLRQQVGKVWDALQVPIRLTGDLYLQLNPKAVSVSHPSAKGDTVSVVVALVAKPKLVAGAPAQVDVQALPELTIMPASSESGFHIELASELPFDFLSTELSKKLNGTAYTANGATIIMEQVELYASGRSVVLAATIKGAVEGTVYLTGIPAYDEATRLLSLENIEYTVETKQALVKAADWVLHSKLREGLAERARWPLGDRIDAVKTQLSAALNRPLNQQMSISGEIQTIRPTAVGITKNSIKAVLIADGTVSITIR